MANMHFPGKSRLLFLGGVLLVLQAGCADGLFVPDTYSFDSAFEEDMESASYPGQTFRQLLMTDMKDYLGHLSAELIDGTAFPVAGDVTADLNFYFEFDALISDAVPHRYEGETVQSTYGDFPSLKSLHDKIAGEDATGQHKDWTAEFVGWDHPEVTSPKSLVEHIFGIIDDQAVAWATGDIPIGFDGNAVSAVYITPEGLDLQQLLQKFLSVSVSFSQGADDYLDDDIEGKGISAAHDVADGEGKPYSALEHHWDEAFGYFGASKYYGTWTDAEIKSGSKDEDGDGTLDLLTEVAWGHSINAAKRDSGAVTPTDFTQEAWNGFAAGRQLLSETSGRPLSNSEFVQLQALRDQAVEAWEKSIAATAVHYINELVAELSESALDAGDVSKHFSELKGFSLGLQFNPRSPMTDAEFAQLHAYLGVAPEVVDVAAYTARLVSACGLLETVYGFDADNVINW